MKLLFKGDFAWRGVADHSIAGSYRETENSTKA